MSSPNRTGPPEAGRTDAPRRSTPDKTGPQSAEESAADSSTRTKALRAEASQRAADSAPSAVTEPSDCGGPLTLDTVHVCESITDGASDTYTLTTSAAHDLLTVQLTESGDASVTGQLTGPDGAAVDCSIMGWSGPASCRTDEAGAYTLVVTGSFGTGGYTLAVSSLRSSPCATVTGDDLAFGAEPLSGSIAAGGASACYAIADGAADGGDVLRMGGLSYELRATFYDSTSTEICVVGQYGDTCELSGTGPYLMVLRDTYAQAASYSVTMNRLSRPAGCTTLAVAPFGDPGDAVASGSVPVGGARCRTVQLPDGPTRVSLKGGESTGGNTSWTLYDAKGQQVCAAADDATCDTLPEAGTYTLLLENSSDFDPADYSVALVPFTATTGCAAAVGTAYDLPLLHGTLGSAVQTDCRPFNGSTGDRIDLTTSADVYGEITTTIIGPSGAESCSRDTGDGPDQDGCVLTGTGPYRAITRSAYDFTGTYTMRIGRLSAPAGCATLAPQVYGSAPTSSANPCWLLEVPGAGTYDVGGTRVYRQDGTRFCTASASTCSFPEAGTYAMVFRPTHLDDTRFTPVFISPAQTQGCTPASDTGFDTGPRKVKLTTGGERHCLLLPTASGNGLYVVATPSGSGTDAETTVHDSRGVQQCRSEYAFSVCKLKGTAPFHLVITAPAAGTHRLTVQRTGDTSGCTAWPQSAFGASRGARVRLTETRQTACLALPAGRHATAEMFDFTNGSNKLNASLRVYDGAGDQVCVTSGSSATTCKFTAGVDYAAVLVGTGAADTYDVVRRDVSSTAKCAAPASLTVGGRSTGWTFDSALDSRCMRIGAQAADKLWLSVRTPAAPAGSGAELLVMDASGTIVCWQHGVACRVTGSTSYVVVVLASGYSGTPIDARVDTWLMGDQSGWAAQCTSNPLSAEGFPLRSGTLTETSTAYCGVMQVKPRQSFHVYGTDNGSTAATPVVNMFSGANWSGSSIDYAYQCSNTRAGDFRFSCSVSGSASATEVVVVVSPSASVIPVEYTMQGVCSSQCASPPKAADLTSLTPASGPAEAENQVVVHGAFLNLGTEVDLARDGSVVSAYSGRPVSVSEDGTSLTVLLSTHGLAPGKYDVVLDGSGYTVGTRSPGYLPEGYTVTGAALRSGADRDTAR
ncbi:hypothetical protein [Streptomyces sp. NPDC059166]|uniref:hypothetical protein n=1 Tax=Streptomyces sp. NPDC059166 TaxID=3346752 RepID=UPI0036874CE6